MACFVKRVQRYTEFPFPPNVLENIFQKNLKITQNLDTNQSKQHPKHLYHTPGSHKNKIALKKPQSKEQPLKRKFENKGSFNFSQKQQIPIIEQNYILMPPKQAHPALK